MKASGPDEHDRTYLTRGGETERAAVHVGHDLAHLVVESLFDIRERLWGGFELGPIRGGEPRHHGS